MRGLRLVATLLVCGLAVSVAGGAEARTPSFGKVNGIAVAMGGQWTDVMNQHDAKLAPCADVLFVGVRGSGESSTADDNMGRMVRTVRDGFRESLDPSLTVKQVGLVYPAYPILPDDAGHTNLVGDLQLLGNEWLYGLEVTQPSYFTSVALGAYTLSDLVRTETEKCGASEKIVLAGYSSGAWVVHITLGTLDDVTNIAGVALIADPARGTDAGPLEGRLWGSPVRQMGVAMALSELVSPSLFPSGAVVALPEVTRSVTYEVCGAHDPVCDATDSVWAPADVVGMVAFAVGMSGNMPIHNNYGLDAGAVSNAQLVDLAANLAAPLRVSYVGAGLRPEPVLDPASGAFTQVDALYPYGDDMYVAACVAGRQPNPCGLFRITGSDAPEPVAPDVILGAAAFHAFAGNLFFTGRAPGGSTYCLYRITGRGAPPEPVDGCISGLRSATDLGDAMYFVDDSSTLRKVTSAGDIQVVATGVGADLVAYDGSLFLNRGSALYRLDVDGTLSRISDSLGLNTSGGTGNNFAVYQGSLYFNATAAGPAYGVFRVTGRGAPVQIGRTIFQHHVALVAHYGGLYVLGDDGHLYRIVGDSEPVMIPLPGGATVSRDAAAYRGDLYFTAYDPARYALYPGEPNAVFKIAGSSAPVELSRRLENGLPGAGALWTDSGILLMVHGGYLLTVTGSADLINDIPRANGTWFSAPRLLTEINGVTYFASDYGTYGNAHPELWRLVPYSPTLTLDGGASISTDRHDFQLTGVTDAYSGTNDVLFDAWIGGDHVTWEDNGLDFFAPPVTLADGEYAVTLRMTDTGGNVAEARQTLSIHPPLVSAPPALIGDPVVGTTLVVDPGEWGPAPVTLSYVWKRDGVVIAEAVTDQYHVVPGDLGKEISVRVTGTKPGYTPVTEVIPFGVMIVSRPIDSPPGRIYGQDRFETAAAIAGGFPTAATVYVANGLNFPDALSAAPAAAAASAPLLLTQRDSLPASVADQVSRLQPTRIVLVGGTGVISESVATALRALVPGATVDRLAGDDRYATSRSVSVDAFPVAYTVYLASGANFPDALSVASTAGSAGAPVVLINGADSAPGAATMQFLLDAHTTDVVIAGGTGVVSAGIEASLRSALGDGHVTRVFGNDRYGTSVAINTFGFGATGASGVYLAVGTGYADALAGAALAGRDKMPLFLVPRDCVPAAVLSAVGSLGASKVTLFGGPGSLSENVAGLVACR